VCVCVFVRVCARIYDWGYKLACMHICLCACELGRKASASWRMCAGPGTHHACLESFWC